MSAQTLLGRARAALDGSTGLPKGTRARVAAWYARAALEDTVCLLLADRLESDPTRLRMASRLACLRVLRPDRTDEASHAWWALSRVCHQHAFELTPTTTEVAHLVDRVAALASSSLVSSDSSPSVSPVPSSVIELVESATGAAERSVGAGD